MARPLLRRYVIVNDWTQYVCFDGRRFWTAKGAARYAAKKSPWWQHMHIERYN